MVMKMIELHCMCHAPKPNGSGIPIAAHTVAGTVAGTDRFLEYNDREGPGTGLRKFEGVLTAGDGQTLID